VIVTHYKQIMPGRIALGDGIEHGSILFRFAGLELKQFRHNGGIELYLVSI